MKLSKNSKLLILAVLFPAYFSMAFISNKTNESCLLNTNGNSISKDSSKLDGVQNTSTSSTYNHTNYFTQTTIPSSYSNYNIFAQTNRSMLTQTNKGALGLSSDKKTIIFTSYSGQIIWSQSLSSNSLIASFCAKNNMTASNLSVKEWTYLTNNGSKNLVAFMVSDNTKEAIITIDLDNGLFAPDNKDNNFVFNGDNVFKVLDSNDYTRMFQIGSNSIIVLKKDWNQSPKLITYNFSTNYISIENLTISYANSNTREIASFIYAGSKTFALVIDKNGTQSGNQVNFSQYLVSISLSGNKLTLSTETKLDSSYKISGSSTSLPSIENFKTTFFYKKENNDTKVFVLTGSNGNNFIDACKFTNTSNLSKISSTSLAGYNVNSVTYSPTFNKMYIANSSSNTNVYLCSLDLSSDSPKLSTIQQSTSSGEKKYFLVPILEDSSKEFLIQSSNSNSPIYMSFSNGSYSNTGTTMSIKSWTYDQKIFTDIGKAYAVSGINLNVIKKYLKMNSINANISQADVSRNPQFGTIKYVVGVTYNTIYDSSIKSSFNITFNINGLAKNSDYSFTWIDSDSTGSDISDKVAKIKNLKTTKYANQISVDDVYSNFFKYSIIDNKGQSVSITRDMISLSYPNNFDGTLKVSINLSSLNLPIGTDSSKIIVTKTYTGFLSANNYSASSKSDKDINNFVKNIYPSDLTKDQVINNFLTTSVLKSDSDSWNVSITNVDDFNGTVTISASYVNAKSQIPSSDQLPQNFFDKFNNIINNKTFTGFKSLLSVSGINSKPSMEDLTSSTDQNTYLPSEIWNQYLDYCTGSSGIKKSDVILLNKLKSSMTNVDDLIIDKNSAEVIDADSSSTSNQFSQGYIKFNVTLRDGAKTNINYTGSQFKHSSDGYLLVDNNLLSKINFPYTITWNIDTYNKYFLLKDENGNIIESNTDSPNVYKIDLNSIHNLINGINNSTYSTSVTIDEISKLINTEGYNYTISLDNNLKKGYTKVTINLSLKDKPLTNSDLSSNPNFTKTIFIYNFKIPMSLSAQVSILLVLALAISAIVIFLVSQGRWWAKKIKYKKLSSNISYEKAKNKKLDNISKKQRYFKK